MTNEIEKQALVAFIAEAKESGVDIEEISQKAQTGVLANKIYTTVGAKEKPEVAAMLRNAVLEVLSLPTK